MHINAARDDPRNRNERGPKFLVLVVINKFMVWARFGPTILNGWTLIAMRTTRKSA